LPASGTILQALRLVRSDLLLLLLPPLQATRIRAMTDRSTANNRTVALWLFVCCALVYVMVVLGGVTRLTGSGLSMVDWQPVTGILPPVGEQAWLEEFAQYRESPEFQKVNSHMDVHDFKNIFWLEYLHRLLGRTIGVVFLVPFLVFAWRGYIRKPDAPKYALMFVLGGMQGLLGWYMVKSGLVDNPHVSQYRLTAHLVAAILVYSYMFWVALSLLYPVRSGEHEWYGKTLALTALVFLTVVSGGFVAGLKAGKIYNTFPMMGEHWIPPGLFSMQPYWLNFFENTTTVQFDHRVLAITTFVLLVWYWLGIRQTGLPRQAAVAVNALVGTAALQIMLGIATLLMAVPVFLGAAHQATAMLLFTAALYLLHSLKNGE
jgi:heme a synthase